MRRFARLVLPLLGVILLLGASSARATDFLFSYTYPPYAFPPTPYLYLTDSSGAGTSIPLAASGWYSATGNHDSGNPDYLAGLYAGATYNDFFVFDNIPADTYTSASLGLYNPDHCDPYGCGYGGPDPSATYYNWDVTTPISTLEASNTGATGIFADLGSGILYGSTTVGTFDNGAWVYVNLNGNALASINAAAGGDWAVGGSMASTAPIPEPVSMLLFGTFLSLSGGVLARKKRAL